MLTNGLTQRQKPTIFNVAREKKKTTTKLTPPLGDQRPPFKNHMPDLP
jgi:hypothetical protein